MVRNKELVICKGCECPIQYSGCQITLDLRLSNPDGGNLTTRGPWPVHRNLKCVRRALMIIKLTDQFELPEPK